MEQKSNTIHKLILAIGVMALAFGGVAYATQNGAYLMQTNTYYVNPDTNVTDDGGTQNIAVGEGMCRSVIGETALIEIDGEEKYLTLRVQLLSNIQDIRFMVQKEAGNPQSYESVETDIMQEDGINDTADYRMKVPQIDSYVKCTAYVSPMSRDVCFYLNGNGSLEKGYSDFVVSVEEEPTENTDTKENKNENMDWDSDASKKGNKDINSKQSPDERTDPSKHGASNTNVDEEKKKAIDKSPETNFSKDQGADPNEDADKKTGISANAIPNGDLNESKEKDEDKSAKTNFSKDKKTDLSKNVDKELKTGKNDVSNINAEKPLESKKEISKSPDTKDEEKKNENISSKKEKEAKKKWIIPFLVGTFVLGLKIYLKRFIKGE